MHDIGAALLVVVGALLILAGCARPLDAAVISANAAAITLQATHDEIATASRAAQREAASRVLGDRSDPAVRAEQIDRARLAGATFRPAWEAYSTARAAWVAVVAAIVVAQQTDEPDLDAITQALLALAEALAGLGDATHD